MCEPPDILRRHNGKMIKPTIAHDGIRPQQVFLYMYPNEPEFDPNEVGTPVFLTQYIRQKKLKEGKEKARVHLNQWPDLVSYAGFLTVEEKYNSNIYFWFFPSQSNPTEDPVALWLQVIQTILHIAFCSYNIRSTCSLIFLLLQLLEFREALEQLHFTAC